MKDINNYIIEKLKKINSKNLGKQYNYFPKDRHELMDIIDKLLKERNHTADLNDIDTSKITDMTNLFYHIHFDGDISDWDVSNVKNMRGMFYDSQFNGDISNWDVSNVEDMSYMFYHSKFNGDISNWDVKNVKDMYRMFVGCPLEKNPPKWYHE